MISKIKKYIADNIEWLLPHFPMKTKYCMVAEFESTGELLHAAEKIRDAGYKNWETHSPFPIHGMDDAMGHGRSLLPWIVFGGGVTGFLVGVGLQTWVHVLEYPLNISGKPNFSLPAFIPVTFELTVLFSAFAAVGGMFALNQLPQFYHPLFKWDRYARVTQDKFFVSIQTRDKKYDEEATRELLESLGGDHVTVLEP